ncbi:hypothetical protein B0H17DRAFT_1148089 [Mycena rosella]|uniref:Uncharacterized protein n=1 Tax=Mycena rosella TaxID=1033263 RepID=A0AAD7CIZ0_MYCRO|nr:hypothetical protein B0H17DRAFT_1148089 [Mycena rosella]
MRRGFFLMIRPERTPCTCLGKSALVGKMNLEAKKGLAARTDSCLKCDPILAPEQTFYVLVQKATLLLPVKIEELGMDSDFRPADRSTRHAHTSIVGRCKTSTEGIVYAHQQSNGQAEPIDIDEESEEEYSNSILVPGSSTAFKRPRSGSRTPPPRALPSAIGSPESPQWDRSRLEGIMSPLFKTKLSTCMVFPMKAFKKMSDLDATTSDWNTFCLMPGSLVSIVVDTNPAHQMVGAFKMAVFGVASPPIFEKAEIWVKQTYYVSHGLQIGAAKDTSKHCS